MTALGYEAVLLPVFGTPRATNSGGAKAIETGWDGTTVGATVPSRGAVGVGAVLRSVAMGMLEALDPGWLSTATRYYQLLVDDVPGTGSALIVRREERPAEVANVSFLVPDRVAEIRATLSLNMSETARALGVERPTVYAWLAGRVTPQRANLFRLARIADIAASWSRRTSRPLGNLVRLPGADGRSIADLLADDTLRDRHVQDRLDAIANQLLPLGAPPRGRRVTGVREAAAHHGLATRPSKDSAVEVDWLTRPSFGDEDD